MTSRSKSRPAPGGTVADRHLVCPACGWDGSTDGEHDGWFRFIEQVATNEHRVEGFSERGLLQVATEDVLAVADPWVRRRIRCGNCLTEFPLPPGIEIEMV
jgi:hypothetical protein